MDDLMNKLTAINSVPMLTTNELPNWAYVLIGIGVAMILLIIIVLYIKCKKRWSGKLWFWRRRKHAYVGEEMRQIPLVTINSSSDYSASRDTEPSAPLMMPIHRANSSDKNTVNKLYPKIAGDA